MINTWDRSREMLERSRRSLAGGVSSPFRAKAPVPLFFENGHGVRLCDVDGNEYIDYQLAWGPMILGYSHPAMVERLRIQAEKPLSYGAQHELEIVVAEKIQSMVPCAERVAFTSSGSEAVQLAHRLARAATARPLILKFEGHYHGWMDSALVSYKPYEHEVGPLASPYAVLGSCGQVNNAAENTIVAPWNEPEILEQILDEHKGRVAAIMMEPVLCNSGCLMPHPGYLARVRELADRHGTLLVFDEVITGFRIDSGGAQRHFGVTPDIATFGKAVGGGVPLSVVAGSADIMQQMFTGGVVFGGTFNGNPFSLAGADVCLTELSRDDGAALRHANEMGARLMAGIRSISATHGIPLKLTGFGAAFYLHFTDKDAPSGYRDNFNDDQDRLQHFLHAALREGVILVPDGRVYVSAAHSEEDIAETLHKIGEAFQKLAHVCGGSR
ncbi:MAG: aspartate aminotransferase family protein [Acidobacteria bacterium]|nr:aspartate aminotransferase family protein [Acidobacteriota bacterium]